MVDHFLSCHPSLPPIFLYPLHHHHRTTSAGPFATSVSTLPLVTTIFLCLLPSRAVFLSSVLGPDEACVGVTDLTGLSGLRLLFWPFPFVSWTPPPQLLCILLWHCTCTHTHTCTYQFTKEGSWGQASKGSWNIKHWSQNNNSYFFFFFFWEGMYLCGKRAMFLCF